MSNSDDEALSWKPRKHTLFALLAVALLPAVVLMLSHFSRPDIPEAWKRVQLGMTRTEIIALVGQAFEPDSVDPELELERIVHRGEAWFGEWAWLLKAHFGEDDRLEQGKAIFVSEHVGMMRTERPVAVAGAK